MNCKCPKCNNVLEYQPSEPEIGIANPLWYCEECCVWLEDKDLNCEVI